MSDVCGDNRFEVIQKAKQDLIESTNVDVCKDEMKVLDSFLFRCWQMGWLDRYDVKESGCEVNFTTKSEDLEEEIDEEIDNLCELGCYMEDLAKGNSEGVYPLPDNVVKELRKFARHFAEWQKQKDEKLFKNDSWNYIEENYPNITQEEKFRLYDISIKSRLAGANTIKQHMKEALQTEYEKGQFDMQQEMMKDAVEGEITLDINGNIRMDCADVFCVGDKVKIIIVKEEKK